MHSGSTACAFGQMHRPANRSITHVNKTPIKSIYLNKVGSRDFHRLMAGNEVVLLNWWLSPFGMRVRIALAEKGVGYEYTEVDVLDKSPLLIEMNPVHKKVPVLIHNGKPICESLIIVQYIDEVWKIHPFLLPKDSPFEHATARFWADYVDKKIHETGMRAWMNRGEAQELAKKELMEHLKLLEDVLGDKPFFGGENFGFVDISLIPFASRFYTYEESGNFNMEDECPKLIAWVKRCMERESVSKALPEPQKVNDFMCILKKKLEIE